MKGEDSERGREYWLTCNTESGGGRDPANIKYIITFILISLLAPVCLLARLAVATVTSAERVRTNAHALSTFLIVQLDPLSALIDVLLREIRVIAFGKSREFRKNRRNACEKETVFDRVRRPGSCRAANRDNLNRSFLIRFPASVIARVRESGGCARRFVYDPRQSLGLSRDR